MAKHPKSKAKAKKPLIPPDRERCQAEHEEGSFMTLGPRGMVRCENKPVVIVTEKDPGPDGQCGAMSLCPECLTIFVKRNTAQVAFTRA